MFDYTKHQSLGCVSTGNHSIYDFEVYRISGQLMFMCHEDPEDLDTYEEAKGFFEERGDDLDQQLEDLNITK